MDDKRLILSYNIYSFSQNDALPNVRLIVISSNIWYFAQEFPVIRVMLFTKKSTLAIEVDKNT